MLTDTEAEEAGPGVLVYHGAQFATATVVIVAVPTAADLLWRYLGTVRPLVLRGGGHLPRVGAHLNPGPQNQSHLRGLARKSQGHLLKAHLGRRV